jgi:putative transposase
MSRSARYDAHDDRRAAAVPAEAHLGAIAATDFFSVEVLTFPGLVRYFVLFVIDLETRRGQVAGIVRQPHRDWMKQVARNLTEGVDGFLTGKRYLIHDRDLLFSKDFSDLLEAVGVKCLKLPAQSPNLNAYASASSSPSSPSS